MRGSQQTSCVIEAAATLTRTPTQLLKVPFGLRDDELVEPGTVLNGKACQCVCPGCGRPLVAYNRGTVRTTPYFGHLPGEECAKGFESAVHLAAKRAVLDAKRIALPALLVDANGITSRQFQGARVRLVEEATAADYARVDAEVSFEIEVSPLTSAPQQNGFAANSPRQSVKHRLRPDLKGERENATDWLEIRVTHAVDRHKQWLLERAGLRVVEVDLSGLLRAGVTLHEVRRATLEDVGNKKWLAHPLAREVSVALSVELMREAQEAARIEQRMREAAATPQRDWLHDGEEHPKLVVPPPAPPPTEQEMLAKLRIELGLATCAPWPRFLDLDLYGNGGSQVIPRIWLSRLYLDWVRGRPGARYFVSDLQRSAEKTFGVKPRWGARDLHRALEQRVLRYWAACGMVRVDGNLVVVTEGVR